MDFDTMDAVRVLADFADSHGYDTYMEGIDDDEQTAGMKENYEHLMQAVKTALAYLDGE